MTSGGRGGSSINSLPRAPRARRRRPLAVSGLRGDGGGGLRPLLELRPRARRRLTRAAVPGPSAPARGPATDLDHRPPRPEGCPDPTPIAPALLAWFDREGRKDLPWQRDPIALPGLGLGDHAPADPGRGGHPLLRALHGPLPDPGRSGRGAPATRCSHLWSGLGYYARARNLHRAAGHRHGGSMAAGCPTDIEASWRPCPGSAAPPPGPSSRWPWASATPSWTATSSGCWPGASGWRAGPGGARCSARLWRLAERETPAERVAAYNQAMMDLGATLCTRATPACPRCPLAAACRRPGAGRRRSALPDTRARREAHARAAHLADPGRNPAGEVLLERRPPAGIWGGLWSLPECRGRAATRPIGAASGWARAPLRVEMLPPRRHSFTHFGLDIHVALVWIDAPGDALPAWPTSTDRWTTPSRIQALGLPAPVRRLLDEPPRRPGASCGAEGPEPHPDTPISNRRSRPMSRMVHCIKLGREAEGLDRQPYPGRSRQAHLRRTSPSRPGPIGCATRPC